MSLYAAGYAKRAGMEGEPLASDATQWAARGPVWGISKNAVAKLMQMAPVPC